MSEVSRIQVDLCVVIYASLLTEDTTKEYISKAFFHWWTPVSLSFSQRKCKFYGKVNAEILSILETDLSLVKLFDDHTGESWQKKGAPV